jgi:DNA-binding transcriptional regulator YiaG
MKVIRHTLVSDGPTDANLIPIIDWTLKHAGGVPLSEGVRADFWRLPKKPQNPADRLLKAVEIFPCDVLLIHRDAERDLPQARFDEIRQAFDLAGIQLPAVAVVPVRMLEAWLCFNEDAIRKASGNPNGKASLNLPALKRVESRPDPKEDLREALLTASELSGRRRKKFNTAAAFWRVVDFIEDFSPLRGLPSFLAFENSIKSLRDNDWKAGFYS